MHAEVVVQGGTIEVQRPGRTKKAIRLVVTDHAGRSVAVWVTGKQQQALREAVREVQSSGLHRWP